MASQHIENSIKYYYTTAFRGRRITSASFGSDAYDAFFRSHGRHLNLTNGVPWHAPRIAIAYVAEGPFFDTVRAIETATRIFDKAALLVLAGLTIPTTYQTFKYLVEDREFTLHTTVEDTAFLGFSRVGSLARSRWFREGYNVSRYPAFDHQAYTILPSKPVVLRHDNGLTALAEEHDRGFLNDRGRLFAFGALSKYVIRTRTQPGIPTGRDEVAVTLRPAADPAAKGRPAELDIQLNQCSPVPVRLISMAPTTIRLSGTSPADGVYALTFRHKGPAGDFPLNTGDGSSLADLRNVEILAVGINAALEERAGCELQRTHGMLCDFEHEGQQFCFFVNDPHDSIQAHHHAGEFYEREELELIRSHVRQGASILDIGANIGNHTVYFSRIMAARNVTPVELQPKVISLLLKNLRLNGVTNVDLTRLGVGFGSRTDHADIFIPQAFNVAGAQFRSASDGTFDIRKGDDVVAGLDYDFLKIDVEGMECDVIEGLSETIRRCRPLMFVEVWNENIPRFHEQIKLLGYEIIAEFRRYEVATNLLVRSKPGDG